MNPNNDYPIGTPGKPWGDDERAAWLGAQSVKRLYAEEVLSQIEALASNFEVASYGALPIDPERYPLFVVKTHVRSTRTGPSGPIAHRKKQPR